MNDKLSVLFLNIFLLIFMITITIFINNIQNIENNLILNNINLLNGWSEEQVEVKAFKLWYFEIFYGL